jgi:hypothetical protein
MPSDEIAPAPVWSKCNVCKKPISFGGTYLKCTVSTCNRKRTQLLFCSDSCWDAHNPDFNHRNPGYTEHIAPLAGSR